MSFPGCARIGTVIGTHVSVDIRTALPRRELAPLLDAAFAWLRRADDTLGATGRDSHVRGWALERLSRALVGAGAGDHRIDAGGDVRVRGSACPGRRWRVGLRDPRTGQTLKVIFVNDLGIATAAGVLGSVTVLGPDLGVAQAHATAMSVMGPAGARRRASWLASTGPYQSLIIGRDGREWGTPGLAEWSRTQARLAG
ncbi:FAD:protein FMN transferase [Nonomuraea sp. LPB2021202275-12-8]|uniref:FAD:protein FMN transferase n=1 Tax=Nonomuraea sp. LPB2021202275-12-8 TaxID=3120159 RepID=UPI00300C0DC1